MGEWEFFTLLDEIIIYTIPYVVLTFLLTRVAFAILFKKMKMNMVLGTILVVNLFELSSKLKTSYFWLLFIYAPLIFIIVFTIQNIASKQEFAIILFDLIALFVSFIASSVFFTAWLIGFGRNKIFSILNVVFPIILLNYLAFNSSIVWKYDGVSEIDEIGRKNTF